MILERGDWSEEGGRELQDRPGGFCGLFSTGGGSESGEESMLRKR